MYARGMNTPETTGRLRDLYGIEAFPNVINPTHPGDRQGYASNLTSQVGHNRQTARHPPAFSYSVASIATNI